MILQKIYKNTVLFLQGELSFKEALRKIYNFSFDHYRLIRLIKRKQFCLSRVSFRAITKEDKERYVDYVRNYFKNGKNITDTLLPENKENVFYRVALYKGNIIGGVGLMKLPRQNINVWKISGLGILPEYRGFGIGQRLAESILNQAQGSDTILFLGVAGDNERAIKLYKKIGFRPFDKEAGFQLQDLERFLPDKNIAMYRKV